jgi:hypothetical protein
MFCFLDQTKTNRFKPPSPISPPPIPSPLKALPPLGSAQIANNCGDHKKAAFLRYRQTKRVDKLTSYVKGIFSTADAYISSGLGSPLPLESGPLIDCEYECRRPFYCETAQPLCLHWYCLHCPCIPTI